MNDIPNIAECTVKASYNNGQAEAESKSMVIKPTTISLSFMRYMLAKDDRKKSFVWPQRDEETSYSVNGSPDVNGYTYRATTPREGYIYIHFDNKPNLFKEFKVDITGELTNIVSDLKEDVREPNERRSSRHYCISNKDIVWIAYSEFQWSANYVSKVRDDKTLREKRMQKFDATQWAGSHSAPDAFTVDNIDGYFPLGDDDMPPQKQDYNGDIFWTPGDIKDSIDASKIQWWKTYYDQVEVMEDVPDERDEVFFCLHDPLGCADELAIDLDYSWKKMEALVIAMQTGIDRSVVLNQIVIGGKDPEDLIKKDRLMQVEKMHKTVLLFYQTGFCTEENRDKYGDHLDKERIELLLGKEERGKQRNEIESIKSSLVIFFKSDYYKKTIDEYIYQSNDVKLIGKARKAIHISNLQYKSNAKDYVYNLLEENEEILQKKDSGIEYITTEFENREGILFEKADVDIKQKVDLLDRVILVWNTILGGINEFVQKNPEFIQTKVNMLNEVRVFRNGEMVVDECFDLSTINKAVKNRQAFLQDGLEMLNITEELIEDSKFIQSLDGSYAAIEQVTLSQKFNKAFQREGKLYDLADHLGSSLVWNKFVARVAVFNLGSAMFQFGKDFGGNTQTIKNFIGITSALAGVVETRATYKILSRKATGEITEQMTKQLLKGLPVKACAVGVWAGAAVDAVDSGVNFYRGDMDAAAMQGLAAILGTVAGVGIWNGWNPLGWIALLASATGFALLAVLFEDEPLEELSKNCQFRLKKKWIFFSDNVFEFNGTIEGCINHHLKEGETMLKAGFTQFSDYILLYERLSDILFGGAVTIESKPNIVSSRTVGPTTIQEHFKKELYVNVHFNMAKMFIADIDLQIYLFPEGFSSGKTSLLLTEEKGKGNVRLIPQSEVEAEFFVALFDIPTEYQHIPSINQSRIQAEIVVLCRCNDGAHNFPINQGGNPRYVAVREKLYKQEQVVEQPRTPFNSALLDKQEEERKRKLVYIRVSGDNIKRGTHDELLVPDNWD